MSKKTIGLELSPVLSIVCGYCLCSIGTELDVHDLSVWWTGQVWGWFAEAVRDAFSHSGFGHDTATL